MFYVHVHEYPTFHSYMYTMYARFMLKSESVALNKQIGPIRSIHVLVFRVQADRSAWLQKEKRRFSLE